LRARVTRKPAVSITIGVVVIAVVIAAWLLLTSDSGDKTVAHSPKTTTTRPSREPPRLKLVIGPVHVQSIGPPAQLPKSLRRALLATAQRYVDDAIIAPLEQGHAIPGYAKMYDPGVKGRALGRDLDKLTEVKMGFRRKRVFASASRVRVDALGAPSGRVALVALTWSLNVDTITSKGRLAIRRHTELTFDKEFGKWLVTAYRVDVERTVGKHRKAATTRAG
jgi:hypothetical protein